MLMNNVKHAKKEVVLKEAVTNTPAALTPSRISSMLDNRMEYQVIKFRSTCTDCVPNL